MTRKLEIEKYFPHAIVLPQYDHPSDLVWSQNIVSAVHSMFPDHDEAVMYGGRDSCLPHFTGDFTKEFVQDIDLSSGTSLREEAAKDPINSTDFRRGCIYTVYATRPAPIMACDMALIREGDHTRGYHADRIVLLGRKPGEDLWRFPGGKVDLTDQALEACARRELQEEAGVFAEHLEYVCSELVDDWRFKKNPDHKIMTALFVCREMVLGQPKAGDDLKEVKWFGLGPELEAQMVSAHKPLLPKLLEHFNKGKTNV